MITWHWIILQLDESHLIFFSSLCFRPLDEGKELKRRFDDIFSATRWIFFFFFFSQFAWLQKFILLYGILFFYPSPFSLFLCFPIQLYQGTRGNQKVSSGAGKRDRLLFSYVNICVSVICSYDLDFYNFYRRLFDIFFFIFVKPHGIDRLQKSIYPFRYIVIFNVWILSPDSEMSRVRNRTEIFAREQAKGRRGLHHSFTSLSLSLPRLTVLLFIFKYMLHFNSFNKSTSVLWRPSKLPIRLPRKSWINFSQLR